MDKERFWDEETAKEYGKFCFLNHSWLQWEDFKKSKEVKKGYEIIEFKHNYEDYILADDGKYNRKGFTNIASLNHIPSNIEIKSVIRYSDGSIWAINDL